MPHIVANVQVRLSNTYDLVYDVIVHDYTLTSEELEIDFSRLFQSWGEPPEDNSAWMVQTAAKSYYLKYAVTNVEEAKAYSKQDPKNASKHHTFVLLYVYVDQLMYHPVSYDVYVPEWLTVVNIHEEMQMFFPNLLWCAAIGKVGECTFKSIIRYSDLTLKWYGLPIWAYCLLTKQYQKCKWLLRAGYLCTGLDRKASRIVLASKTTNTVELQAARSILPHKDKKHHQKWYQRKRQPELMRMMRDTKNGHFGTYWCHVTDMLRDQKSCRRIKRKQVVKFFWSQLHAEDMFEYLECVKKVVLSSTVGFDSFSERHPYDALDNYVLRLSYDKTLSLHNTNE